MVSTLQSVGMNDSEFLIEDYSATAFFADVLVLILRLHVLAREDALFELKADAVLTEQFGEQLALNLLNKLINSVAESEVALVGGMGVQVQVHEQSLFLAVVFAQLLDRIAGGLLLRVRIGVVSIQILVERVHSAVSP